MADDKSKKPKIDLKARLGRGSAVGGSAGTSAVPLPVPGSQPGSQPPPGIAPPVNAGRPAGIAPPPGISAGIPLPPFAPRAAPPAPSKPVAAQQTIKVEVGEEVHEERRKASKKTAIYAVIAGIVGLGLGFAGGGAKERGDRGTAAVSGAGALEKDVKAANDKVKELNEKLIAASEKLGNKTFPADLAKDLAAVNVPFDATNLEGKQVGSLPSKVLRPLLSYTTSVQDLNKTKDSLKNLLGFAQPKIEKYWKEEKDPVLGYSVVFRGDQRGMLAELVPVKEPFPMTKDWPESFTIVKTTKTAQGPKSEEKKATRWKKGDLTGNDPIAIPVDPASSGAVSGEEIVYKLSNAMRDIRQLCEGSAEDVRNPTPGLIKEGEDLAAELHKAATAK